jgi:hypothetical protein
MAAWNGIEVPNQEAPTQSGPVRHIAHASTVSADVYMHGRWPLMMAGTNPRGYRRDGMSP